MSIPNEIRFISLEIDKKYKKLEKYLFYLLTIIIAYAIIQLQGKERAYRYN